MNINASKYILATTLAICAWISYVGFQISVYATTAYIWSEDVYPYQEMIYGFAGLLICSIIYVTKFRGAPLKTPGINAHVLAKNLILGVVIFAVLTILRISLKAALHIENSQTENYHMGSWYRWIPFIALPMLEEIFFRGILLRIILDRTGNSWFAILFTAILFALLHLHVYASDLGIFHVLTTAFLGIFWGMVWHRTGSIGLCSVLHIENNILAWLI